MQKGKLLLCFTEAVATLGASNSSKNAGKLPFLFSSAESSNYPKILAASKLGQNIERIKQQLPGKTFSLGPLACLGHFPLSFVDTRLCAELLVLPAPQCGCCTPAPIYLYLYSTPAPIYGTNVHTSPPWSTSIAAPASFCSTVFLEYQAWILFPWNL